MTWFQNLPASQNVPILSDAPSYSCNPMSFTSSAKWLPSILILMPCETACPPDHTKENGLPDDRPDVQALVHGAKMLFAGDTINSIHHHTLILHTLSNIRAISILLHIYVVPSERRCMFSWSIIVRSNRVCFCRPILILHGVVIGWLLYLTV